MGLIPGVQQLGQLGRERGSGSVRQAAVGVKLNARFGGVGDHKAQRRLPCQRQIGVKVPVRIDGAGNAADLAQIAHRLTLCQSPQQQVVATVLGIDLLYRSGVRGGYHHHLARIQPFVV